MRGSTQLLGHGPLGCRSCGDHCMYGGPHTRRRHAEPSKDRLLAIHHRRLSLKRSHTHSSNIVSSSSTWRSWASLNNMLRTHVSNFKGTPDDRPHPGHAKTRICVAPRSSQGPHLPLGSPRKVAARTRQECWTTIGRCASRRCRGGLPHAGGECHTRSCFVGHLRMHVVKVRARPSLGRRLLILKRRSRRR